MDRLNNPFSPGAGTLPPELVGRDSVIDKANVLFGRVKKGRAERSLLMIGLRGVGKTVLLNKIRKNAEDMDYIPIYLEAHHDKSLVAALAPHLQSTLLKLDRFKGAQDKIKRGFSVLKNFISSIKISYDGAPIGIDLEPEKGTADTGDLEIDLPELFQVIAEAAQSKDKAIAILIDEVQYFTSKELSALIMGMHRMQQYQLPLVFIGAGLPILPKLAGESKSYAERLFAYPNIGPLSEEDTSKAIELPLKSEGSSINKNALKQLYTLTKGYPYFIQEWGYQVWNHAKKSPITLADVELATHAIIDSLDENFFKVRFDRLTNGEKKFLRAMAELNEAPFLTSDIAKVMKVKAQSITPRRATLIKKGMIYSPEHGFLDFTVPLFGQFMKRAYKKI